MTTLSVFGERQQPIDGICAITPFVCTQPRHSNIDYIDLLAGGHRCSQCLSAGERLIASAWIAKDLFAKGEHRLGVRLSGPLLRGRKALTGSLQTLSRFFPLPLVHIQLGEHHLRVVRVRHVAPRSHPAYDFLEPSPRRLGVTPVGGYQRTGEAAEDRELWVRKRRRFSLCLCARDGCRGELTAHALNVGDIGQGPRGQVPARSYNDTTSRYSCRTSSLAASSLSMVASA